MARHLIQKPAGRAVEYMAASAAIAASLIAAIAGAWSFTHVDEQRPDASLWRILFSDLATLGFVRVAVIMLAIYSIGSLAALLASGRWIRSIGKGGLEIDAARNVEQRLRELELRVLTELVDLDREEALFKGPSDG